MMHWEINGCIGFYPLLISLAEAACAGEHGGCPGRDPTLRGLWGGVGAPRENHPGLSRNSISQAQHGAAPGGESALEEPHHIPMGGFGLFTDSTGSPAVTYLSTTPNFKNNNERCIFSVWLRSAVLLQDGNPTGPSQSRLQAEETLCFILL